jgi:hypothetical protein
MGCWQRVSVLVHRGLVRRMAAVGRRSPEEGEGAAGDHHTEAVRNAVAGLAEARRSQGRAAAGAVDEEGHRDAVAVDTGPGLHSLGLGGGPAVDAEEGTVRRRAAAEVEDIGRSLGAVVAADSAAAAAAAAAAEAGIDDAAAAGRHRTVRILAADHWDMAAVHRHSTPGWPLARGLVGDRAWAREIG